MLRYTASQAGKHFGELRERALAQPVGIERRGEVSVVMISAEEYERLKALDTRRSFAVEDLPAEMIARLEATTMDPRHAHLDALMDDE